MLVSIDGLSFTYARGTRKERMIFDEASVQFKESSFYALMGPSGSGKTTLFRLLCGELTPDDGQIFFNDSPIAEISNARARTRILARVFQEYLLIPYLDAVDNILLAMEIAGEPTDRAGTGRVHALLERVGLTGVEDMPVDELSGGEQQRVAIARALINSPAVLLADEPTGALDSRNAARIAELLKDLAHEGGLTVIAGTHDPAFAATADEIVRIDDHRIHKDIP